MSLPGRRKYTRNIQCIEYTSIYAYVQTSKSYSGQMFHAHCFEKHSVPLVNPINGSKQTLQVLFSHEQVYGLFNSSIVLLHQNCWKLRAPLLGGTGLQPRISRCVYGGGTTEVHRTGDFFASRSYQGIT